MTVETNEAEVAEIVTRSIVGATYKERYAARAAEKGRKDKAAKRSCCDWLADQLAKLVLNEDKKRSLNVDAFEQLLEANAIRHEAWKREGKGWQGRFRMSGRLALQREVAESGVLVTADGEEIRAPKAWCDHIRR